MRLRALFGLASGAPALVGTAIAAAYLLALPPGISTAAAQQTREMKRVVTLWAASRQEVEEFVRAFDDELAARGWVNGRTMHLVHRFNDNKGADALDALAKEIAQSNPSVIWVPNDRTLSFIQRHTTTLP